jgi:N-acyl-D-aspartate/D-glutamate deacylase
MSATVDVVIAGATVYDGLGSPGVLADVAVSGDRVVTIAPDLGVRARRVIDASGLAVAPGFIDPHTHSDVVPLMGKAQPFKLYQGVTTEIVGNCGNSAAPLTDQAAVELHRPISSTAKAGVSSYPRTFAGYLDEIEAAGPTNHVASLVGHTTLRMTANGMDLALRDGALETMVLLAEQAFADGAIGLSSGLIYAPGCYADVAELAALARVAGRWQRPYATHMRDEGDHVLGSIAESVEVARRSRCRLQLSHCKLAGRRNHGRAAEFLAAMHAARADGVDVTGDQYPYTTGETFLAALLPSGIQAGGPGRMRDRLADPAERAFWHDVATGATVVPGSSPGSWQQTTPSGVLISMHAYPSLQGSSLSECAAVAGSSEWDALCEIVRADPATMMVYELMGEADVREIMSDPGICVGSDNSVPVGLAHQRAWGCFPTVLGRYCRDLGVLSLPEAIRKMTSAAADAFGLTSRGRLQAGVLADLVVVDPATVGHPGATPASPSARPSGVPYVLLAGHVVVDAGDFTGDRFGRVLRAGHAEPADRKSADNAGRKAACTP